MLFVFSVILFTPFVQAQTIKPEPVDVNSSSFRLLICDGPVLPAGVTPPKANYVPCDFKGLMMQIQHFINIAMVGGVIIAILGMTYAGILYISGNPAKIKEAHDIFPSILIGFIVMLSAWFIVYQVINWLTGGNTLSVLLGNP